MLTSLLLGLHLGLAHATIAPVCAMKVISGSAKGLRLKAPRSARPTTSLVRGAAFSMLGSVEGCRVLDLFAGSGALGIEALSRGAARADFVDQDARSCAAIRHNLVVAGLAGKALVRRGPAGRALRSLEAEYDVVFMDPPYADPGLEPLLAQVAASPRLVAGAVVVVFHSSRLPLSPGYDGLGLLRERRHGDTTVSIYRKGEDR